MLRKVSLLVMVFLLAISFAYAGTVELPKTGQTTSYYAGDDGTLQRGIAWPSPRFTDNGNTVTDNLTGLMWTKNANLPGGTRTWQQALDYVAGMNAGTYSNYGYTDWRLPNINELESLVHTGQANTATWLNGQGFTNVASDVYWSSSTYAYNTVSAWFVNMNFGYLYAIIKSNLNYVWPVRAGQ